MAKKQSKGRGRPKKKTSEKRSVDIRIPVKKSEKDILDKAVKLTDRGEMASWARELLLKTAAEMLKEQN